MSGFETLPKSEHGNLKTIEFTTLGVTFINTIYQMAKWFNSGI